MKKYIKLLILIFCFSFGFYCPVNAASIEINGPQKIEYNESGNASIVLTLEAAEEINKIEFDIESNNKSAIKLTGISTTLGIINLTDSKVVLTPGPSNTFFKAGNIGTIGIKNELKSSSDVKLMINNIKFTKTNNEIIEQSAFNSNVITLNYTPVVLNSESKLSGIKYSVGKITPEFKSNVKEYKIYNIKDTIKTLTLMPEGDVTYSISCNIGCVVDGPNQNKITLALGKNEVKINTTSRDGKNHFEYSINVFRGETTDGSNFLKSLTIENIALNEEFDKNNLDYTVSIPYAIENLVINAIPEDEQALVEIKGNKDLKVGENVITVTVTSTDTGNKKIYNIIVTKSEFDTNITTTKAIVADPIKKDNNLLILIIIIATGLIIIGISGYFIFRKKKPKKLKDKKIDLENKPLLNENEDVFLKPSVDDALEDLMNTKELELNSENIDNYNKE